VGDSSEWFVSEALLKGLAVNRGGTDRYLDNRGRSDCNEPRYLVRDVYRTLIDTRLSHVSIKDGFTGGFMNASRINFGLSIITLALNYNRRTTSLNLIARFDAILIASSSDNNATSNRSKNGVSALDRFTRASRGKRSVSGEKEAELLPFVARSRRAAFSISSLHFYVAIERDRSDGTRVFLFRDKSGAEKSPRRKEAAEDKEESLSIRALAIFAFPQNVYAHAYACVRVSFSRAQVGAHARSRSRSGQSGRRGERGASGERLHRVMEREGSAEGGRGGERGTESRKIQVAP